MFVVMILAMRMDPARAPRSLPPPHHLLRDLYGIGLPMCLLSAAFVNLFQPDDTHGVLGYCVDEPSQPSQGHTAH